MSLALGKRRVNSLPPLAELYERRFQEGLRSSLGRRGREEASRVEQSPAPGTEVSRGSVVTLVVAARPTAPKVEGMKRDDAANALMRAGFGAPVFWEVDPQARGEALTVVRQEPPAGAPFEAGQLAKLWIIGPVGGKKDKRDDND